VGQTASDIGTVRPDRVTVEGPDNLIEANASVMLDGGVEVAGRGNRLSFGQNVRLERYAPAGFAATVPDIGVRRDIALIVEGDDNVVEVADDVRLAMNIVVRGRNNHIRIERGCYLHGFGNLITDGATLTVGAGTTMVQGSIQLHEPVTVTIGKDCMISSQVYISVSDIHPIYDRETGARINPARPVEIGDHVWLGLRAMVLKGARIGEGAVLAAGTLVSGEVPARSIVAGSPARVMRRNVDWRRDLGAETIAAVPAKPVSRRWWPFGR